MRGTGSFTLCDVQKGVLINITSEIMKSVERFW